VPSLERLTIKFLISGADNHYPHNVRMGVGEAVSLFLEGNNPWDPNAIVVLDNKPGRNMVGRISRPHASLLAPLLNDGHTAWGPVTIVRVTPRATQFTLQTTLTVKLQAKATLTAGLCDVW
jgi:hypothetical protein